MIMLKPVVLVLLLVGCHKGCCVAQELANCFSGEACRNTAISFGVVEECCNSLNVSRSYTVPGTEECVECRYTYRCFVAECGDADLSAPADSVNTTYAMNDGERVCCSSGQYCSWTSDTHNQGTCNLCPVPETTPEINSSSQSTDPVNMYPSSGVECSTGCIIGVVVGCVVLLIICFIAVVGVIMITVEYIVNWCLIVITHT